jgi:hypothetical protein
MDEDAAKTLTMSIAAAQYDAIGSDEYETERMRRIFKNTATMTKLDADLLRATVFSIQVYSNGDISVRLKNGQTVERRETA